MAMIQPSFTSSKWNMGEILPFLAQNLKMMVKSGLEKNIFEISPCTMQKAIFGPTGFQINIYVGYADMILIKLCAKSFTHIPF